MCAFLNMFIKYGLYLLTGIVTQNVLLYELKNRHNTLNHDKLRLILQYLHRIGVIMWYKEIPELKDSLFVKPSFLITLFKVHLTNKLQI